MTTTKCLSIKTSLLAMAVCFSTLSSAQAGLSAAEVKSWSGEYAENCSDTTAPRISIGKETISLTIAGKKLVAKDVEASYSFLGKNPPKDFDAALMASTPKAQNITILIYKTAKGRSLALDIDQGIMSEFKIKSAETRYSKC